MGLAEKMFSRSNQTCPLRSECTKQRNNRYYDSLFDDDWRYFVVKRDEETGEYDWFTRCCETLDAKYAKPKNLSTTCC